MTPLIPPAALAVRSEGELIALAHALGAKQVEGWSTAEESLLARIPNRPDVAAAQSGVRAGRDPLGDAFCQLRSAEDRRPQGATYTPSSIVAAMVSWAAGGRSPDRIVDPGVGSGRFLVAAGRRFRRAHLLGVELDPVAALLARAHLATAGLADRARVVLADYREPGAVPPIDGSTLFIGNPPYVRHHLIGSEWKGWLSSRAAARGMAASQLAGLHVHFMLATLERARAGDRIAFITAAEWLDVNYGSLVRQMFLDHLGGQSIHLISATAAPFPDAATTAVITCCEVGQRPTSVRVQSVDAPAKLADLSGGKRVRRERLEQARRWTPILRRERIVPEGYVELGELCRVHRGQVTGANKVWIEGEHSRDLPERVKFRTVTKARDLLTAGSRLEDASTLRRVIDLPAELDELDADERHAVGRFLRYARDQGAHLGYIARHRRAWWSVELPEPAPILTTYMARRPPAFVRNVTNARHINIAHGIYPRDPLPDSVMDALAAHLSRSVTVGDGRTYAGGLTKFEPGEVERLLVPHPKLLAAGLGS